MGVRGRGVLWFGRDCVAVCGMGCQFADDMLFLLYGYAIYAVGNLGDEIFGESYEYIDLLPVNTFLINFFFLKLWQPCSHTPAPIF